MPHVIFLADEQTEQVGHSDLHSLAELVLRDEDMPMFAPLIAEPAIAEAAPASGDDHLLVLELGEVRLRIGSAVPPERVAALVAALRAG